MRKVADIIEKLEQLAPLSLAEPWDNVGLMTGDREQRVSTVFVCLDVTSENVKSAISCGADMIVSHHPLIFEPLKNINGDEIKGKIIKELIKNDISVYSAHTNLDNADGGTNDALAERLGLTDVNKFENAIGRIGVLENPMMMADFVERTKDALNCATIRFVGDGDSMIKKVALCSGAGGDGIYNAYKEGADVYVTSDIRHHEAQLAYELGLNVIDAGHFETENTVCEFITEYLEKNFEGLTVIPSRAKPYFHSA